ncbi:flavin monoamine oxidase family protein [Caulobacter soli]|uniref:flavin monoamine oxidase family protein n=1 Tax=Caulobacter soli TaxID=2708539 RepID=UPI0013ECE547|nr:NAD(P)/FAD-dependent oxidoreductase [Caulobacter soli]
MTEVDVAIIGAGAAGLAAAATLASSPLNVVVLEAQGRIGGRAHTVPLAGLSLDLGCEWLHSADHNPLVDRIAASGLTIDKTPPPWAHPEATANFTAEERQAYGLAFAALDERVEAAAREAGDRPVSALLEPGDRWTPLLNAFSAYYNGEAFDQVSVQDYAAYDDSEQNWRVAEGYGAGIVGLAPAGVRILSDCPVSLLRHDGPRLSLETPRGVVQARAAIVCVSTAVLAAGALRILPELPAKLAAAEGLPLGLADKVFLSLHEPEAFAVESMVFGATDRTATGSYHMRPLGRPIIEAFFGGAHARALEAEGPGASAAFAIEELVGVFGSGLRDRVSVLAKTAWASDPWARGSYSHALPGRAGERAVLAAPVDGRLFFAGEACSAHSFSTAHGAWETGERAAREVLAALGS